MNNRCKTIRQNILKISNESGHGHIPACFSIVEILFAVYSIMKHDPQNPKMSDRDIFILSKGHAALAQYCILAELGYFAIEEVFAFGGYKAKFGCHADRQKIPGIEASTGSLGHGIGIAVGMALGLKLKNSPRKVYTIIGDGEANEGTIWEALMVADNLNLNNLIVIYDNNKSHERGLQISNPSEKLKAFGCEVYEVDGHDENAILDILQKPQKKIKAVVANTIKGHGCRTFSINHYAWHRKSPNNEQLLNLMEELNASSI